ncbi:MAG: biotin-dependent carboxyltransferase family protein [Gemmataceae bacterium]|nr:biotin-dependent carboxyltransferase family protein [Gemmataceae bacterium]
MSLRVLAPGLHTLVVDFGRSHCRSLGVPVGGAADRTALALGNALVGNPPDAAALEFTLVGPTLQAGCDLACVVYGAPFDLESDRQRLAVGTTFTLTAGEILQIRGTSEKVRAYLCVGGGLQTPAVLGSRSGLTAIREGDELPCVPGRIGRRFFRHPLPWEHERDLRRPAGPLLQPLRSLPGPQADWFPSAAGVTHAQPDRAALRFRVTPASNRMGLRLDGPPLPVPDRELVSEPVCPGAVQVTRDGQCIILGIDGQTIGGYPKIAQIIGADLDALGQLRPGDEVCLVRVTLEEAELCYRRKQAALSAWVTRLRAALAGACETHQG